jgi:hypothetical protein
MGRNSHEDEGVDNRLPGVVMKDLRSARTETQRMGQGREVLTEGRPTTKGLGGFVCVGAPYCLGEIVVPRIATRTEKNARDHSMCGMTVALTVAPFDRVPPEPFCI